MLEASRSLSKKQTRREIEIAFASQFLQIRLSDGELMDVSCRWWKNFLRELEDPFLCFEGGAMIPLPPRGLPPAKPFPKPITTPPKPDNSPRKQTE